MMKANYHPKVLWLGMNDAYDNIPFLQKYAPKYYSAVNFEISDLQNRQILSKARSVKIIRSAKIQDYTPDKKDLVIKALRSKSKTLQSLKGSGLDLHDNFPNFQHFRLLTESLSSWRAFLSLKHLKSLTIESSALEIETAGNLKAFGRFKWRFWAHVLEMRSLKHLSCNFYGIITNSNYHFLQKLGTFQRFLSSLKTLTLDLNLLEDQTFEDFNLDQLYQQVSILRAKELSPGVFTRFLGSFQYYQNLEKLSILQVMILEENEDVQPVLACLKNLCTLTELKSLEFSFDFHTGKDFAIFLENFSLPPNIQDIRLCFHKLALGDPQAVISSDLFEQFCQKWKNLSHLNSLCLTFLDSLPELNLVLSILKVVPKVISLYYSSSNDLAIENPKNTINFQYFWDSIQHLQPTLEILHLESCSISIKETQNIQAFSSCALKTLSLCGKIIGENQILNLFKLFSSSDPCESQLLLEGVLPTSKENLASLLNDLRCIPRNIRTCVNINMIQIAAQDMMAVLCSNDQLVKIRNKENIKLTFSNTLKLKQSNLDKIVTAFEETGILCCLQISDQGGNILFSGDNWDKIS